MGSVLSIRLRILGLRGFWGSSCQLLSVFFVYEFQALRDSGVPDVRFCLVFLFVNFGPPGILGLQLSGIIRLFCLSILGLEGF